MNILKYDGTEKEWKLFRKKKGQQEWEWEDYGVVLLNNKDLIDMSIFLKNDYIQVFTDFESFISESNELISELMTQKKFSEIKKLVEFCQNTEIEFTEDKQIIVYDNLNNVYYTEERYVYSYTDENSYEWQVGIEI